MGQGRPWEPLGFFSKKLDPAQTRYSAYDRELLACVSGIRHFRFMLEGRRFTLYTDHKPLTFALTKAAVPWTARQCRHLSYISEFTNDIRHVAGTDNVVADTMSRPPQEAGMVAAVAATPQSLDYAAIAEAQRSCPSIETARDLLGIGQRLLDQCRPEVGVGDVPHVHEALCIVEPVGRPGLPVWGEREGPWVRPAAHPLAANSRH